jgi:hypothetical protein
MYVLTVVSIGHNVLLAWLFLRPLRYHASTPIHLFIFLEHRWLYADRVAKTIYFMKHLRFRVYPPRVWTFVKAARPPRLASPVELLSTLTVVLMKFTMSWWQGPDIGETFNAWYYLFVQTKMENNRENQNQYQRVITKHEEVSAQIDLTIFKESS